jgi:predicted DCC family thiol-disulfide oxidoreductase YuxK
LALLLLWLAWRGVKAARRRLQELPYIERSFMLFDGDCVLCNAYVDFCLARLSPNVGLKVAALNSEVGAWLLHVHRVSLPPSSFIFIEEVAGKPKMHMKPRCNVWKKSDAALRSLSALSPTWLWLPMMLFEPLPYFVRDAIYDLGWRYRRVLFGTTACRVRSKHDLEPCGRGLHSCEPSSERHGVLADCAEAYDSNDDDDDEWPSNVLSRHMVVYDAGIITRRQHESRGIIWAPAAEAPTVDAAELALCRRVAARAAQTLEGVSFRSEASARWEPFFIVRGHTDGGATSGRKPAVAVRRASHETITPEGIRDAFGGCIDPKASVEVEPLCDVLQGEDRDSRLRYGGEADGQVAMMRWRALLTWLSSQEADLQLRKDSASWVTIGNFGERQLSRRPRRRQGRRGRTSPSSGKRTDGVLDGHHLSARCMPRVVVALTQSGSLVGVCAIERCTL